MMGELQGVEGEEFGGVLGESGGVARGRLEDWELGIGTMVFSGRGCKSRGNRGVKC